jgi:dihydroneopterin aldolase
MALLHGFRRVASSDNLPILSQFRYSRVHPSQAERTLDITFLHGLKVDCVIGIWDWERRTRQTIIINLDMACDVKQAADSDDIKDAVDYKAVSKRLMEFVGASEYQLVETLAEKVADIVLSEFKVPWVRVRINKKGAVRNAGDVGIIIERGAPG